MEPESARSRGVCFQACAEELVDLLKKLEDKLQHVQEQLALDLKDKLQKMQAQMQAQLNEQTTLLQNITEMLKPSNASGEPSRLTS